MDCGGTQWVKAGGGMGVFRGLGPPDDTQINPPPRESNKQRITQNVHSMCAYIP